MIQRGLGVILGDKDAGFRPEAAFGNRLDDASQGQVVIGHRRTGHGHPRLCSRGVIVRQQHDDKIGHVALFFKIVQFFDKLGGAIGVRDFLGKADICRAGVGRHLRQVQFGANLNGAAASAKVVINLAKIRISRFNDGLYKLAVIAKREAVIHRVVPDKTRARIGEGIVAVVGIAARKVAERLFQVIGDIGLIGPLVAVGAEHAAAIKIIH